MTQAVFTFTLTHTFYLLSGVTSHFSEEERNTWSIRKQMFLFS